MDSTDEGGSDFNFPGIDPEIQRMQALDYPGISAVVLTAAIDR